MPYDPQCHMIQQQQVAAVNAAAMLGHGKHLSFPSNFLFWNFVLNYVLIYFQAGLATQSMFNPTGLPMTSATPSLHGLKYPEQFYSSAGFNALTPSTATGAHSSISPADLHMLSHC